VLKKDKYLAPEAAKVEAPAVQVQPVAVKPVATKSEPTGILAEKLRGALGRDS
jgi:hypothetical protein